MDNILSKNMHYVFYKDYLDRLVSGLDDEEMSTLNGEVLHKFEAVQKSLFEWGNKQIEAIPIKEVLYFTVLYPGILVGLGYPHEIIVDKKNKGQFACGLSLDYVTGMPYIPGSSIKGIIHHAFDLAVSGVDGEKELMQALIGKNVEDCQKILNDYLDENAIVHAKDIFYGAYVVGVQNDISNYKLIDKENITPHINPQTQELQPTKEPNTINMLKIKPGTVIAVVIGMKGEEVKERKEIYATLLETLGVGAKTSVGFGSIKKCNRTDYSIPEEPHAKNERKNDSTPTCAHPGCNKKVGKKPKTGGWYKFCYDHKNEK